MTQIPQPVQKNTTMWFCNSVPITPDYSQTLYFDNQDSQMKYFRRKIKHVLYSQSYQRAFKGTMRVNLPFHELDDCNYIVFQNISSLESYFFAFLDTLTYISTNVTEVSYTIDIMQTYLFSYNLEGVFVERTHIEHDKWFYNTTPEPLQNKATLTAGGYRIPETPDGVCIMATQTPTGSIVSRTVLGNYSGLTWSWGYSINNPSLINEVIENYQTAGQAGAIQRIFQYPKKFTDFYSTQNEELYQQEYKADVLWPVFPYPARYSIFRPKNLKMFCYPYAFVLLDNSQGSTCELRHEFWRASSGDVASQTNHIGEVHEYGVFGPQTSAMLLAKNYGWQTVPQLSIANSVSISNFPECAWNEDTYKVWLAQTKAQVPFDLFSQTLGTLNSLVLGGTGGFLTGGLSGISSGIQSAGIGGLSKSLQYITGVLKESVLQEMQPAAMHGTSNALSLAIPMGTYQFLMRFMRLAYPDAALVDDYFTRYGYSLNRIVGAPNRNARPHWTYIKTSGCNVIGTMPANMANEINRIYDNGITWWNPNDDFDGGVGVGNYSADNRWPEDPAIPDGTSPNSVAASILNDADINKNSYFLEYYPEGMVEGNGEKLDSI